MLALATLIEANSPETQQKNLADAIRVFAERKKLLDTNSQIVWILRFLRFHNHQHPSDLNQSDVESFLSSLATEQNYGQLIQAKAAQALTFLYCDFLQIKLPPLNYIQTKARRGFIDHFGSHVCRSVLNHLPASSRLMAELAVYGKLKLAQVVKLKLNDIDIKKSRIKIRTTHAKTKFTLTIPLHLILDLRIQTMRVRQLTQIKNQQFSKKQPFNQSQNEYLFPVANTKNPQISSPSMQLALLKNDLQIAIKNNLRYPPQSPNQSLPLPLPLPLPFSQSSEPFTEAAPTIYKKSRAT